VIYATGLDLIHGRRSELLLATSTRLHPGRYTLTLTAIGKHHHRHTTRKTIVLL